LSARISAKLITNHHQEWAIGAGLELFANCFIRLENFFNSLMVFSEKDSPAIRMNCWAKEFSDAWHRGKLSSCFRCSGTIGKMFINCCSGRVSLRIRFHPPRTREDSSLVIASISIFVRGPKWEISSIHAFWRTAGLGSVWVILSSNSFPWSPHSVKTVSIARRVIKASFLELNVLKRLLARRKPVANSSNASKCKAVARIQGTSDSSLQTCCTTRGIRRELRCPQL